MEEISREVKKIWWSGTDGDAVQEPDTGQGHRMVMKNEFHGDHDEDWICLIDESGKEIERHNPRFIASIVWA